MTEGPVSEARASSSNRHAAGALSHGSTRCVGAGSKVPGDITHRVRLPRYGGESGSMPVSTLKHQHFTKVPLRV